MTSFVNRFKIPTLLGLAILILGISAGVYLIVSNQTLTTKASLSLIPQNITQSNTQDTSLTISWQTAADTPSFITYGLTSADEQTALDDRDIQAPKAHSIHYVTLKGLLPKTTYQYKIINGKYVSEIFKVTTAGTAANQTGFGPVIGSVLNGDTPLDDGVAYLAISNATTQSALIKNLGNFVIPISLMRKNDLSDLFQPEQGTIAKLTVISSHGEASALFKLTPSAKPLPAIKLGQDLDFTTLDLTSRPASASAQAVGKYDLNDDGLVNAADYAIVLKSFGKYPPNQKADLNGDGIVDQKDLDSMSKRLNQ